MNNKAPAEALKLLIHYRKTKSLLLTIAAIFGLAAPTFAQSVPSYIPTNGLVGWWPFSGNANDESGNGNNGTVVGATPISNRFGHLNSAFNFNGSSNYIRINILNQSLQLSNNFSFSVWTNLSKDSLNWQHIIAKGDNSTNEYSLILRSDSTLHFDRQGLQTLSNIQFKNYYNNWSHIVCIIENNQAKVYINSVLMSTSSLNSSIISSIKPLTIGAILGVNSNIPSPETFVKGDLDDLGIWNRILSQTEIRDLYLACSDSFITHPSNLNSLRGSNSNFSATMSGIGNNFQWQTNPIGCGWQNVPNANQYAGATTSTLLVNGLTVSNHNQRFRVIASKNGCADTSNVVTLTISDIAVDSINIINLKADTTYKGNRIRQLETDLANKHDTLYVGSTITTDTLNISIRTGLVSTSPAVNTLNVYPNPAATVLNIVLDKPGYYVAKLSGITAQTVVTPTSGTIDISGLANGIYILTISDSNNKLISINKVSIVK
jgi:hypothetical protein